MKKSLVPSLFTAVVLASASVSATEPAAAAAPVATVEQAPQTVHRRSLTFSPLHAMNLQFGNTRLFFLELTYEHQLLPKFSLAGIAGLGRATSSSVNSVLLYDVGAQARYYLVGDFDHGMTLAGHVQYMGATAAVDSNSSSISAVAGGLQIGPAIGYKVAADFGLTFDAQLGVAFTAIHAIATDGNQTAQVSESDVLPMLRLNLGWSF